MAMMLIFVSYLNYLVDSYLMYAASAIAANTIMRSLTASAAPLFTNQMFSALGVGGGGSLLGGVGAVLAVIPFLFYRYGKAIRVRSRFAPTSVRPTADDEEKQEGQPGASADAEHLRLQQRQREEQSAEMSSDTVAADEDSDLNLPAAMPEIDASEKRVPGSPRRKRDEDVEQNSLGEPEDESIMFGKESSSP
jgi:DHA1 family multidrug resistance protein-like MFS transporter